MTLSGQAQSVLQEIKDLLVGEEVSVDAVHELALEVTVSSGWYSPMESNQIPSKYKILLSTGGPEVRIRGTLDMEGVPDSATLEQREAGQDWTFQCSDEALLTYARYFDFVPPQGR